MSVTDKAVPAIAATNLVKRYGASTAVAGVSFEVERGELVGFLGPNGAGKTTTMRMLTGLIRPSQGECRILGEHVPGASLRRVGTMIEEPSFYPYMSGRDNLRHAALLHGDVESTRIDEVLEFVGMRHAAGKRVKAYSQGMRQRLGLARALLWRPDVLILDEPTNGLDPEGIAEVRELLAQVAERGTTVLVSSHILGEIEKLVERVLVIEGGKLLYSGSLTGLLRRLDEARVAYLLEATAAEGLRAALTELGYQPEPSEGGAVRVWVPESEASTLIRRLTLAGVEIVEARRERDNLEGAYLRLLRGGAVHS